MEYITLQPYKAVNLRVEGYQFNRLTKIFLSSGDVTFPSVTAVNAFTTMRRVSSLCPAFTGYEYPTDYYTVQNDNVLFISLTGYEIPANIDVIFFNSAGYSKLSDHDIQVLS